MKVWIRGPGGWALGVMLALGCSNSGGSSSDGCGSSQERCDINTSATVCGDRITLECYDGAIPDAASQCEIALQQDDQAIYCCTSAVEEAGAFGDWGGGGFASPEEGGAGFGGAGFGGAAGAWP